MKKLLLSLIVLASGTSYGAWNEAPVPVNSSSWTATSDTTKQLGASKPGDILEMVIVSSPTPGGLVTVFDGQGTNAVNVIGKVSLNNALAVPFFVRVSSGITYSITNNANGVTFIYRIR